MILAKTIGNTIDMVLALLPNERLLFINIPKIKGKMINKIFVIGKNAIRRPSQNSLNKLALLTMKYVIKMQPTIFLKTVPPRYSEISIISKEAKFLSNL